MNRSQCTAARPGLVLAAAILPALAFADTTRPASFANEDPERRFERLLEWPELKGDASVMLYCYAIVEASGKMDGNGCFTKDNFDTPFAIAVNRAAKKARLSPAVINGRATSVYLQYRVEFIAEGEQRNVHLYLNPGYGENVAEYGYEHIAGQRATRGEDEPWMKICPQRAKYAVWARAYLSEAGRADPPNIEHAEGVMPTPACLDAISATIAESAYTPAYADGEPVPSTFVELFGN